MMSGKNSTRYSKCFLLFLKFLTQLVCVPRFKLIAVLYPKKSWAKEAMAGNFNPHEQWQDQNTSVGIRLVACKN